MTPPPPERRREDRRRVPDRRVAPGHALDVSRLEHENLCSQMDEVLRTLHRIESELHQQNARISRLEMAEKDIAKTP